MQVNYIKLAYKVAPSMKQDIILPFKLSLSDLHSYSYIQ